MYLGDLSELRDYNWHGRFVVGSNLPVWQAGDETGLMSRYRAYAKALRESGLLDTAEEAFAGFLLPGWSPLKPSSPNEVELTRVGRAVETVGHSVVHRHLLSLCISSQYRFRCLCFSSHSLDFQPCF